MRRYCLVISIALLCFVLISCQFRDNEPLNTIASSGDEAVDDLPVSDVLPQYSETERTDIISSMPLISTLNIDNNDLSSDYIELINSSKTVDKIEAEFDRKDISKLSLLALLDSRIDKEITLNLKN